MICPICLCCSKMTLLYWCICPYVIYLCIVNSDVFYKNEFKLYVFMNACNVDDWFVFVKKSILKSPIIIVGQCEGFFCIMFSRIELKCDICILGGLYIAIMYNVYHVLSLKKCGDKFNTKICDCCVFCQWHIVNIKYHNAMFIMIYGTFVIKHCKFLSLNEHLLFLFLLNKEYVMLIYLDMQGHLQNVMLKNEY
jgi:hypothetical protein